MTTLLRLRGVLCLFPSFSGISKRPNGISMRVQEVRETRKGATQRMCGNLGFLGTSR
jgi:hypothetical protein